jgi:hypothetical protein
MTDLAAELLGTWRLVSWSLVYEDGRPPNFRSARTPSAI